MPNTRATWRLPGPPRAVLIPRWWHGCRPFASESRRVAGRPVRALAAADVPVAGPDVELLVERVLALHRQLLAVVDGAVPEGVHGLDHVREISVVVDDLEPVRAGLRLVEI